MLHHRHTHAAAAITLVPGFAAPQADAQAVFRAALWALAEPGQVRNLDLTCGVPNGLSLAMTALLLALVDADTPVWLPPEADPGIGAFLSFHCGCPLVPELHLARFVVVPHKQPMPALADCDLGELAYPDRSATLLLEVSGWSDGPPVQLQGPGIESSRSLAVSGLPTDFWPQWRANQQRFPLGVDVLLTCGPQLVGLPRTTGVEV